MRKECKFCGAKFSQGAKLCPNCGSTDIKLVAGDNLFLGEESGTESDKVKKSGTKKTKSKIKWKKIIVISVSVLVGILVLLIVAFQLLLRWADKQVEKDKLSINEQVQQALEDSEMSDEEWKEVMLPILDEVYINEVLQGAENMYGDAWKEEVFPLLNQLYDNNQMDVLHDIYVDAQINFKPIVDWEHFLFIRALYDVYDIEEALEIEARGEQLQEWQYAELLTDYYDYENFESRAGLTQEEKDKLMPYVTKLREDAKTRWNFDEGDFDELRELAVSEYGIVDYGVIEGYVKLWMEKYVNTNETKSIEEELIASADMDNAAWKRKIFPMLDDLYEQGLDEELYDAIKLINTYDRTIAGWQHYYFAEKLLDYFAMENVWSIEAEDEELDAYDYTVLLYGYLTLEHCEELSELSSEETERLQTYWQKAYQDSINRWNFTEEQWKEVEETLVRSNGFVYWSDVSEFIEQWMEQQ